MRAKIVDLEDLLSLRTLVQSNEHEYHLYHPPYYVFLRLFPLQRHCLKAGGLVAAAMRFFQVPAFLRTSCPRIHLQVMRTDKRAAQQDHRPFESDRRKRLPKSYKSELPSALSLGDKLLNLGSPNCTDCPISPRFLVFVYEGFGERGGHGFSYSQR